MTLIEELKSRGYLYQCTDLTPLKKKLDQEKVVIYTGFDCTAKSLHIGNLMQIMVLRLFQKYGHKIITVIGNGTAKIGDPSGKSEIRKYLSDEDINENAFGIKKVLSKLIKFGNGPSDALMLNNSDWLENLSYIHFLREYGKTFSINRMLTMDFVKTRLKKKQSLTFLEFNYMLLQAFDFLYLNTKYNCFLQVGGSDQWGNIIAGVELIRKINKSQSFGLTTPLLTNSSGKKMGKSVNGAIWISNEYLSPYEYYQYWRNTEDKDVFKFAKLYCEFSESEEKEFDNLISKDINEAKKKLAYTITEICHGKEKADEALDTSIKVFEQKVISNNLPHVFLDTKTLLQGVLFIELLCSVGISSSKSQARKLIRSMAIKINGELVLNENLVINFEFCKSNIIKISSGKKKHVLVKVVE